MVFRRVCISKPHSVLKLFLTLFSVGLLAQQSVTQQHLSSPDPLSAQELAQLQAKADAGNPDAQLDLGRAYEVGNGVLRNDERAVKWYRAAAEQGNAIAQNNLGLMLRSGRGIEQDKGEAVRWYKKAAQQKNPAAMFNLGTAYYNGDGVAADNVAACAWFLLAKDLGSVPAIDAVKRMNEEAKHVQIEALEKIGDMYRKGDDLPKSNGEAVNWYRKAAEDGPASAEVKLATVLLQGWGGPSSYAEARGLCEKAAQQRYAPGVYCVGTLYEEGLGVTQNYSQAVKCFNQAANMGYALAMLRLGQLYWKGEGVKQDKISAYEFTFLASTSSLPEAKQEKELLEKELDPKEVKKGQAKAVEWLRSHNPL